jgi:hypothetical protein
VDLQRVYAILVRAVWWTKNGGIPIAHEDVIAFVQPV